MIVITTNGESRYRVEYHLAGTLCACVMTNDLHVALTEIKNFIWHEQATARGPVVPLPTKG